MDRSAGEESKRLAEAARAIKQLGEVMTAHGLSGVDVTVGDVKIRLRGGVDRLHRTTELAPDDDDAHSLADRGGDEDGHVITSPMIGTFYTATSPGQPPFVHIGDRIESGQTIGIIEAMKIMNEIPADYAGIVEQILVTNGQAVEYGSPLLRIATSAGVV